MVKNGQMGPSKTISSFYKSSDFLWEDSRNEKACALESHHVQFHWFGMWSQVVMIHLNDGVRSEVLNRPNLFADSTLLRILDKHL